MITKLCNELYLDLNQTSEIYFSWIFIKEKEIQDFIHYTQNGTEYKRPVKTISVNEAMEMLNQCTKTLEQIKETKGHVEK